MDLNVPAIYRCFDEALKFDKENLNTEAFRQYLTSINISSQYLLQYLSIQKDDIKKIVILMKMCFERIEELLKKYDMTNDTGTSEKSSPSPSEISKKAVSPNSEILSPSAASISSKTCGLNESNSWYELTTDESQLSNCSDENDISSIDKTDNVSTDDVSTFDSIEKSSQSWIMQPSPMEIAMNKNKALIKRFKTRLNHVKQPSIKTHMSLELRRRLSENLKLAEAEQKEIDKNEKEKRKILMQAVKRRVHKAMKIGDETGGIDPRINTLCKKCICYEHHMENAWISNLRDHLSKQTNEVSVQHIIKETLNSFDHPLTKWLKCSGEEIEKDCGSIILPYEDLLHEISIDDDNVREELEKQNLKNVISKLQKELDEVISKVNNVIHIANEVMLLVYDDIEKFPDGKSISINSIGKVLFEIIWKPLFKLFRLVHYSEELSIRKMIMKCKEDPLKFLELSESDVCDIKGICLKAFVNFQDVIRLQCPSDKVDKLLNVISLVCNSSSKTDGKYIGADDLLPLLTYVFIFCNAPELTSEIYAVQNFMTESDMYGQRGYCISSMQTVLSYILSLNVHEND